MVQKREWLSTYVRAVANGGTEELVVLQHGDPVVPGTVREADIMAGSGPTHPRSKASRCLSSFGAQYSVVFEA
jgi:hypothetical protein